MARDLRLRALADAPDAFGSTFEEETGYGEPDWREWVTGWDEADHGFVVAERDAAWLGMAVGDHEPGRPRAHLYGMWVEPSERRSGIGAALVDRVVRWASERGAAELHLGVTEGNDGAATFYERLGFEDTGVRSPLRPGSELVTREMFRRL